MINKIRLTSRLHKLSKAKNVPFNILLQVYFFESFLIRLAKSEYREMFVLKGGFLLSSVLGIEERSTLDLDFNVRHIVLEVETIHDILSRILTVKHNDSVHFILRNITNIMQHSPYEGYQVSLIGTLENIRVPFTVDIAAGDPITPGKETYRYPSMVLKDSFVLNTYNVETILAEKLHTVIDKRTGNSRMKDLYDIYILFKTHRHQYSIEILKQALRNTFEHRNTSFNKKTMIGLLETIKNDAEIEKRWTVYVRKNHYVENLSLLEVVTTIIQLIEEV